LIKGHNYSKDNIFSLILIAQNVQENKKKLTKISILKVLIKKIEF